MIFERLHRPRGGRSHPCWLPEGLHQGRGRVVRRPWRKRFDGCPSSQVMRAPSVTADLDRYPEW